MKKTITLLLIIILLILATSSLVFVYQISSKPNFDYEKEFKIEKGQSVDEVAQNLLAENFIKSKFALKAYLYLKGWQSSVQAGIYLLSPMNIIELSKTIVAGRVDNEIKLTFIEGWTIKEMAVYLYETKLLNFKSKDSFLNVLDINDFRLSYDFLQNEKIKSLEGFLFPDTYYVYKDSLHEEIVQKMLDNFNQKLSPALKTEIKANGRNFYDVLILASILEKEISREEDRKIVAGILWKRLDNDMLLQVDATLKYIIGKKDSPRLTLEELKIDSPYNTYKYKGLPPSPISNPGESAIRAAIYPKDSDFWFYLSTKEGETIFSRTLDEHNLNVEKYLR